MIGLLICAAGFSECSDPEFDVLMEAQSASGMAVERCGGPQIDDPDQLLDADCVASNQQAGTPYESWTAAIGPEGSAMYLGEVGFTRDGVKHVWHLRDAREQDDVFSIQRCTYEGTRQLDCAPETCIAGC